MNESRRGWLGFPESLPALLTAVGMVGGAWIYVTSVYGSIDQRIVSISTRVIDLEHSDKDQEAHFARIEAAQTQDRQDTRDRLNDLQKSINDVNGKLDTMHDQLLMNSAASRPETRRWTKP
jgi:TolA-binding protein